MTAPPPLAMPTPLDSAATVAAPLVCPACGGTNASDAVFCANPSCGKALGEFRYALEAHAGFFASQGIRQGEAELVLPAPR